MVIGEPLTRDPPHDLSDSVDRVLGDLSELQASDGFPARTLLVQPDSGGVAEGERLPSGSEVEESRISLLPRILITRRVLSLSRRGTRVSVCPRGNTDRVAVDNLCAPRPRPEPQQRRFPALHDVWWQRVPQPSQQGLGPVLTPLPERGVHGLVQVRVPPVPVGPPHKHSVLQQPGQRVVGRPHRAAHPARQPPHARRQPLPPIPLIRSQERPEQPIQHHVGPLRHVEQRHRPRQIVRDAPEHGPLPAASRVRHAYRWLLFSRVHGGTHGCPIPPPAYSGPGCRRRAAATTKNP